MVTGSHKTADIRASTVNKDLSRTDSDTLWSQSMVEWPEGLGRRVPKPHKQTGQSGYGNVPVRTERYSHSRGGAIPGAVPA